MSNVYSPCDEPTSGEANLFAEERGDKLLPGVSWKSEMSREGERAWPKENDDADKLSAARGVHS